MAIPIRREDVVLRQIHGALFLVDITDKYLDESCSIFELNEMGAIIWNQMDGVKAMRDIAALLQEMIIDDVPLDVIEEDVSGFIQDLSKLGFVEVG